MTCDEAFELLTSTTGTQTANLDRHLHNCQRCRQMREVLAPAIELFATADRGDARGPTEIDGLPPTRWSEIAAVEAAVSAATLARPQSTGSSRVWRAGRVLVRAAALVALGAAIGLVGSQARPGFRNAQSAAGFESSLCNRPLAARIADAGGATPQAIQLAASCIACHHESVPDRPRDVPR